MNLETWKKQSTRQKNELWHSIQARYNIHEAWQKKYFFEKISGLWRESKSQLVSQIQTASTNEKLAKLKPDNISSMDDWMDFVKEKTSAKFLAKSEKLKEIKKKQLPHTCSHKGYARLAEEMRNISSTPNKVTWVIVWTKAHMRKDGQPVDSEVAETIERLDQNTSHEGMSTNTNVVDDAIGKVLGHDHGYVRGYGHGVTKSKFLSMSQKDNTITFFPEECDRMTSEMTELKYLVSSLLADKAKSSEQNSNHTGNVPTSAHVPPANLSSPPSVTINDNAPRKCMLLDWIGSGKVIAEGRWSSNDPSVLVHHIPLGPNVVRVWVDTVKKPNSYLWRPTSDMMVIDNALGTTIAWPADKVKI